MGIEKSAGVVFPRGPAGDQNNSVQKANYQMGRTFGGGNQGSFNSKWRGGSRAHFALLTLIQKLLSQLGGKSKQPPPVEVRPVYGAPIDIPDIKDEGAKGVYGSPAGTTVSQKD